MYLGQMVEFGHTDQVFTNPVTTRARDYITADSVPPFPLEGEGPGMGVSAE